MPQKLVAYFSATGKTERIAERLAEATYAQLYEIRPERRYTKEDLNWHDKNSRSSLEMRDKSSRPALLGPLPDLSRFDTVFLGFPIWWYVAPTVINTFLESVDTRGKRIVLFATSGISGFGNTLKELRPSAPEAELVEGAVWHGLLNPNKLQTVIELG